SAGEGLQFLLGQGRKGRGAMVDRQARYILVMVLGAWLVASADRAQAQGPGASPEVPQIGTYSSLLGNAPGSGGGSFSNLPGTGGFLGGRAAVSTPRGDTTSVVNPASAPSPT